MTSDATHLVSVNELIGIFQRLSKFLNNRASTRSSRAVRLHTALAVAGRASSAKELFLETISKQLLETARATQAKEAEEAMDAGLPPPTVLAVRQRLGKEAWGRLDLCEQEVYEAMAKAEKEQRLLVKQGEPADAA